MESLIILLVIVAVIVVVVRNLPEERRREILSKLSEVSGAPEKQRLPYKINPNFLNWSEKAFFDELKKVLPPTHHIFSKVRIIDFITPTDRTNYAHWRNRIWSKHIDFLICNSSMKPVLGIEINGSSHGKQKRIDRDKFVSEVYESADFPLMNISVGTSFANHAEQIVKRLGNS